MHDDDHDDDAGAAWSALGVLLFLGLCLAASITLCYWSEPVRRRTRVWYCRIVGKEDDGGPARAAQQAQAEKPVPVPVTLPA